MVRMTGRKHPAKIWSKTLHRAVCAGFVLGFACCFGQVQPPQGKPSPAVAPSPVPPPANAPSLFDHPAQPAKVTLVSGKLTVQADNSSLADILHQISQTGGMSVDGLQTSGRNDAQRVFGNYGPGAPRDVISDLLHGMGYNVMMLGETPSGTPRQLTLTARTAGGVPNPTPQPQRTFDRNDDNDNSPPPPQYNDEQQETPPANPQQPFAGQPGVRTPQQILQQLQQMRQQQQSQQDQPDSQSN